jgi:M6 family metalloprotease-like protein/uncharacterized repeat protein (TIGR02543 family)
MNYKTACKALLPVSSAAGIAKESIAAFFNGWQLHLQRRGCLQVALVLFLTSAGLLAAPYGPQGMPIEFTQPDGTILHLRVFGDEFYGRAQTGDGYTVVYNPATQSYEYATLTADGKEFATTGKAVGKADPKALGLAKGIDIKPEARAAKARKNFEKHDKVVKQQERWEALKKAKRNYESFKKEVKKQEKAGKKGIVIPMGTIFPDSEIPASPQMVAPADGAASGTSDTSVTPAPPSFTLSGDVVGLTILIDFYDAPGTVVTPAQVDDFVNKPGYTGFSNAGSVYDYFHIQSGGKLRFNNNVTYYVRVPKSKAYYNDKTLGAGVCGRRLLTDALNVLIANGYDFSQLTTKLVSGQNRVRSCNMFFAGANSGVWAMGLWPHKSALTTAKSIGGGMYVSEYQVSEIGTTANLKIGTFCHENGHLLLGYPDLYSYDGNAADMGTYSLMAGGNSGGGGTHPTHIDPYLKEASGWMNVIDLNSASQQRCTVQVDGNQVYRYNNPARTTEYFLFELRDNTGYEGPYGGATGSVNPGTGLVTYHVYETGSNTASSIWTADNPGCSYTKPYEMLLVEANQKTTITPWYDDPSPDTSDAFRASGKSAISDITTPDLKFWVPTQTAGGRLTASGCDINSISADGNVMTFQIGSTLAETPGIGLSSSTLYSYCNYGTNAAAESFSITNSQGGTLNYSVATNQTWLSCTPASGSVTTGGNLITVNFATSGLAAGTHTGTITVTDPAASPATQSITVTLIVTDPPYLTVSAASIAASGYAGLSGTQAMFRIWNSGGGTLNYSASEPDTWISLSQTTGLAAGETDTVYVNFDATSLAVGTYTTTITVTSSNATNPTVTIPVTFTVVAADLLVTTPDGWENWVVGTTKTITWSSTLGGNVKIDLLKAGSFHSTIIAETPNDGSHTWTIPGSLTPALDYKIKITSVETPAILDQSNLNFVLSPDLPAALDTTDITWTTSGNANWFAQTAITKDGVDAAECGNINNSQSTSLQATIDGPGTLTFWWKVSSQANADYLRFYLDNVEQAGAPAISGDVTWTQKTITIPYGSHTIKWTYAKNGSLSDLADSAWVDKVVFTSTATPEIAVEQPVETDLGDGTSTIDFGAVNHGSSSPLTFTIRNTGTANLTGLSISNTGTHSADYTVGAPGATTLAPGASTTFTVTFSPGGSGTRSAALQIASNDFDENPFDINLTGSGVPLGTLAVSAGDLTASGIAGGPFTPLSKIYTLTNVGSTPIDWTAVKTVGWLDVNPIPASGTLIPGEATSVTIAINSNADSLPVAAYSDTIAFTNTTNGNGDTTRAVALHVSAAATYIITYQGNGNTGGSAPADDTKTENIDLTLAGPGTLVRTGYSFSGWNTAANGSGTAYTASGTYSTNAPLALFAQWSANTYTVYFDATGGTVTDPASKSATMDAAYGDLPATTRDGYTFMGWFTSASGGSLVTSSTTFTFAADQTLYARWNSLPIVSLGDDQTVIMIDPVPWTPEVLPGLKAWYDAADESTITKTAGNRVSQWRDKSGNTFHVNQSTDANRPLSGTRTLNDRNALDFSRTTAQSLVTTANITGQPLTAFAVASFDTSLTDLTIFDGGGSNRCMIRRRSTDILATYAASWMDGAAMSTGATMASAVFNGASSSLRKDGGTATTGNPGTGSLATGLTIGNVVSPSMTLGMDGMIGEVIFASGSLAAAEREKAEGYLARQWGLLDSLPETHTYKTTGPTSLGAVANPGATASDPESNPLTYTWSKISGPGAVTFSDPAALDSTASFRIAGTYVLRLSVSDGIGTSFDEITIIVSPALTVTYNTNGATGGTAPEDASSPYAINASVSVLGAGDLVRANYTFAGWNTAANGSGTAYQPNDTFAIAANTTLYAQWTPNTYIVTFDPNGGSAPSPSSKNVTYGSTYGDLPTTTRSGSLFTGWFTVATGGTKVTNTTSVTATGNHTLFAQWSNQVTVSTTDGNGISGNIDWDSPGTFGGTTWQAKNPGALNEFTRKGYLRFDLSSLNMNTTAATLKWVVSTIDATIAGGDQTFYVYGITDETLDSVTLDSNVTWANAPANNTASFYAADLAKAQLLGTFAIDYNGDKPAPVGTVVSLTGQALIDFLNADTNGVVTLIIGRVGNTGTTGGKNLYFAGDANTTYAPPSLVLEGTPANTAPTWTANPITKATATVGSAYSASLAADASDADNDPLSFAKVSGPDWLNVATDGTLSGMPSEVGTSPNAFVVSVSDGTATAVETTLNIPVQTIFQEWAAGTTTFTGDANGDGMADGLAWLLGSNAPQQAANHLQPAGEKVPAGFQTTFQMLKPSARGSEVLRLQYSNDLGVADAWTSHSVIVPNTSGPVGDVDFTITGIEGTDLNQVQATVPSTAANGTGKLFIRLAADAP